jgi:hypothetical protein
MTKPPSLKAKQRTPRRPIRHPRRRGIVLLIVISVLVLFMLMLVTFAVVSGHYRDAARSFAFRKAQATNDSKVELDLVLQQILSGPESPYSALYGHDLLRDLYGSSVRGQVIAAPAAPAQESAGTFVAFYANTSSSAKAIKGYYSGCVLTVITGNCKGQSTRITHYEPVDVNAGSSPALFRVESFENGQVPNANDLFVVNDKPFSGTGLGSHGDGTYRNDSTDANGRPLALMPHLAGYRNRALAQQALAGGANEPWDAFDYQNPWLTAVQTDASGNVTRVFPAFHRPDLINYWEQFLQSQGTPSSLSDPANRDLLRQIMFRPLGGTNSDHLQFDGSNFSFNAINGPWDVDNDGDGVWDSIWIDPGLPLATAPDGRKMKRLVAIMIRDLDGRVHVNAQGHPEFAKDYARPDGAVAGPLAGSSPGTPFPDLPRGLGYGPAEINFLNLFQFNGESAAVAAASYRRLLQGTDASTGEAIPGRYGFDGAITNAGMNAMLNRRPGLSGPSNAMTPSNDPLSVIKTQGFGLGYAAGVFSNYGSPSDVWGRGAMALDYAGQPYPFYQGQNTDWLSDGSQMTAEINDNPYEISLLEPSTSVDTPYTVAELERVLRNRDGDMNSLPQRLYDAIRGSGGSDFQRRAQLISTLSSHVPTPRSAVPAYMRETFNPADPNYYGAVPANVLEVALAQIRKTAGGTLTTESARQAVLRQIMPFEFFKGQMFDLNRPFGNGVDDNNNGVVDEPGESNNTNPAAQEQAWTAGAYATPSPAGGGTFPLNGMENNWWQPVSFLLPGGMAPVPPAANHLDRLPQDPHLFARQLYARNLYCLMRLLVHPDYVPPSAQFDDTNDPPDTSVPKDPKRDRRQRRSLFYRQLAQFAINAVDMRDPDAIMTPFEYDEFPFDGWHVDGYLDTNENTAADPLDWSRQVVWGLEQPDLLITETKAFHNRRVRDTAQDTTMKLAAMEQGEKDPDQIRIPEGSTFIELYSPRSRAINNPKFPSELYNAAGQLDLARMAPGGRPVWQLAISEHHNDDAVRSQTLAAATLPDTFGPQPHTGDLTTPLQLEVPSLNNTPPTINLERFVWFGATQPAAGTGLADNTFYNSNGWNAVVEPGGYLVVGPRTTTILGSMADASVDNVQEIDPSPQQILLPNETTVTITGADNVQSSETPGTNIRQPRALVVDMRQPDPSAATVDTGEPWPATTTRRIGLNVTEPLPQGGSYYPPPTHPDDAYDDLTTSVNLFPDKPFDSNNGMPLETNGMIPTGSYGDRHTVVLQRLANPTQAFDPVFNPYITVDWASLDVTVFRGEDNTDSQDDEDPGDGEIHFGTRMRGNLTTGSPNGQLWGPLTRQWNTAEDRSRLGGADGTGMYFEQSLGHTFGYVNSHRDDASMAIRGLAEPLNATTTPAVPPLYTGEPSVTFPWLTWNNRPFANPMELLVVPTSSPQRLGSDFRFGNSVDSYPGSPAYPPLYALNANTTPNSQGEAAYQGHFNHLLAFFLSKDSTSGGPLPDLHRLFDYVETPSPYVGTEKWYRPEQVDTEAAGEGYRAPFNKLSRFRDPGRININTVSSPDVWNAIVATYPDLKRLNGGNTWDDIVRSRRSEDNNGSTNMLDLPVNPAIPSIAWNPFRPADAYDLVPLAGAARLARPVDATLLRSRPADRDEPLFENSMRRYDQTQAPWATDRNAYFRYQPYAKLSNMLTTNSNTFAVWTTIGYFEAIPNPGGVDVAHPDGYQLGGEMRFEDGAVRRPRAFYLIDRSIPVAYEPGQQHNIERCVLQRRYLETP